MTSPNDRPDQPPVPSPEPVAPATPPPAAASTDFKNVIEDGARAIDQRAQALGREAEQAAARFSANPAVRETADLASRVWGLILLAFGLWFFADITLKMDLPALAWGDLWPLILIVLGGLVVIRGLARRT
jgi:hypothetical protein